MPVICAQGRRVSGVHWQGAPCAAPFLFSSNRYGTYSFILNAMDRGGHLFFYSYEYCTRTSTLLVVCIWQTFVPYAYEYSHFVFIFSEPPVNP